jgi:hypothetical protein
MAQDASRRQWCFFQGLVTTWQSFQTERTLYDQDGDEFGLELLWQVDIWIGSLWLPTLNDIVHNPLLVIKPRINFSIFLDT